MDVLSGVRFLPLAYVVSQLVHTRRIKVVTGFDMDWEAFILSFYQVGQMCWRQSGLSTLSTEF